MLHVLLVAVNTYQLAHKKWVGCFIVGFAISFIWTFNVKKIAIGRMQERIAYAMGAAIGTLMGLGLSIYVYEILKL
jgi:multidrug transporter EmrE-like cation transporter